MHLPLRLTQALPRVMPGQVVLFYRLVGPAGKASGAIGRANAHGMTVPYMHTEPRSDPAAPVHELQPRFSVVSPTFNELKNVDRLVEAVCRALQGIPHEILVVDDDSPDLTWKRVEELGRSNPSVRLLRRTKNRGLSRSVIDGFSAAAAGVVACIDSDLQHDPDILPDMLREIELGADLVVGCRYMPGGGTGDWSWIRRLESMVATRMAQGVLRLKLRDPMSGYFAVRQQDFLRVRDSLNGDGFKILIEIAANLKPKVVREIPYTFRRRVAGESKLSSKVVVAYLRQLWRLSSLRFPTRFAKFSVVGAFGIVVNLVVLGLILRFAGVSDWRASAAASAVATINNYILNNLWTFRDRVRRGLSFVSGFFSYLLACLVGLTTTTVTYAGLSKATEKLLHSSSHLLPILYQFVAILIGSYFNYKLNKIQTWPSPERVPISDP